jgi:hypothetical protein
MHTVGEKWILEFHGARVLAVYAADGFHLSLTDPDRQLGVIALHRDVLPDLNDATSVARALLESYLRENRHVTVDERELFQTVWRRRA